METATFRGLSAVDFDVAGVVVLPGTAALETAFGATAGVDATALATTGLAVAAGWLPSIFAMPGSLIGAGSTFGGVRVAATGFGASAAAVAVAAGVFVGADAIDGEDADVDVDAGVDDVGVGVGVGVGADADADVVSGAEAIAIVVADAGAATACGATATTAALGCPDVAQKPAPTPIAMMQQATAIMPPEMPGGLWPLRSASTRVGSVKSLGSDGADGAVSIRLGRRPADAFWSDLLICFPPDEPALLGTR